MESLDKHVMVVAAQQIQSPSTNTRKSSALSRSNYYPGHAFDNLSQPLDVFREARVPEELIGTGRRPIAYRSLAQTFHPTT